MASKSARSVFDFLRLAQSWLRIVAASGINFQKLWRPEQNFVLAHFVLAQRLPLQFSPVRPALSQIAEFI
jgi:hypothetical protein